VAQWAGVQPVGNVGMHLRRNISARDRRILSAGHPVTRALETVEGAIRIATKAHRGQTDKQGAPYILHPLRVGASLWRFGDEFVIAGILHDVVEDTVLTFDGLKRLGASDRVISAVASVTKGSEAALGGYEQSIRKAMEDPIGLWVKAADVADNASRLGTVSDEALRSRLTEKYAAACRVLGEQIPGFAPGMVLAPQG